MKVYNKFVESKKEPQNKNDIWFDGSSWKMYKEGVWRSFTLPIELAKDIEDAVKDLDLDNYLKKTDVDSTLSETSTNPVENRVITERLNNIKTDTPDWNASERENGFIQNKIGGDVHLNSLKGVSYITLEDGSRAYRTYGEVYYSKCKDDYSGGYRWYRLSYTERFKYLEDVCYGTREWGSENEYQYRFPTADEINDNYMLEGTIICYIDPEYMVGYDYIEDIVYWGYNETGVENPIPEWFISDEIARQESVDELREETTALWENLDHGTFPDLTAGDLAGRGESVPASFGFRASGGKSIKDGRAYIKRIKGNSLVWNNMIDTRDRQGDGGYVYENDYLHLVEGHKYAMIREKANDGFYCIPVINGSEIYDYSMRNGELAKIFTSAYTTTPSTTRMYCEQNVGKTILCDLTQMFQAGNEPSTIEEFQSRVATLGVDMYAYNEGQVIHCNTESIKSVGDNAWDEKWENGTFDTTSGEAIDGSWVMGKIRSENPIKILPNEEYCVSIGTGSIWVIFLDKEGNAIESPAHNGTRVGNAIQIWNSGKFKTPTNAASLIFYCTEDYGSTYNHDILISLYHSGWKAQRDDQYQPYWQDILPLPIIRKYFPDGMKKAGAAHDEIRYNKESGKWEYSKGKIKSVDLGDLNWKNLDASNGMFYLNRQEVIDLNMATHNNENIPTNLISSLYASAPTYDIVNIDKVFRGPFTTKFSGYLTIKDTSYTDVATFKESLQGVILYYESNNWKWEELDAEDQNFRDFYNVADFGTEMSQSNNVPSAAFSADIIYQFNAVDMIREHEMEINELQSIIATMQAQLTSLINK